ncbi:MAG TPA: DUF2185 domain-containing protein [Paracoccaceae bacterium]|nr:DUF2185 domain-containing protein [Paracoccaceae bacterium]
MPNAAYELLDPRPIRQENPYTFFVPTEEELAEIRPGQSVKLMFRAIPPSDHYGAERMWVQVTSCDADEFIGTLDNDPTDIPGLKDGDIVQFKRHHIIGVIWDDPKHKTRFADDLDRWFARCFVDPAVLEGRARVGLLYREAPEHRETDKYPDTGWRIRADVDQLSDEEYNDDTVSYVAIGKVLNRDDSFLHLLDSPIGSAFLRHKGDRFEPNTVEYQDE